jgi:N-acetylated-alpha-linked acidic dipeptidase
MRPRRTLEPLFALSLTLASSLAAGTPAAAPAPTGPPAAASPSSLAGFADPHAAEERALEARFDAALRPADLREWMKRLSARPHHVGSAYDRENAEFLAGLFRSWGYQTAIEEFRVLFPTPKLRRLEMVAPTRFRASLVEPPLAEDETSSQAGEQLPTYNAYSADGDVTGELVYVNYGVPKDYETLERRGIDVRGKIVIARYGGSWRGIKPKVAAEHGAIGCLIYSDPRDDGYFQGDVYPRGAYRGDRGVQRGSVADMPLYSGDPLTPGVGATADAPRLPREKAATLAKIPVLPISYADAQPLLAALGGPIAPEPFRGALPIPYHLGPGPARVHLQLAFNWDLAPVRDVIARLPGAELPDEWIVRGNHHDAWVNGAEDPISGLVAELAEARAVGELAKAGFRPRRTIVYAAWDGEEPGLLGSTEWVETHAAELARKAAVYINSDTNGRGFLEVGGSHTLERFMNEVARDVTDPQTHLSVLARRRASDVVNGPAAERREMRERRDLRIAALGSGSDYTPFLQHLGIASLNLGFGGEDGGGSYHSIYDSFDHYVRFSDPRFDYGIALAQTAGRAVLRLAQADVLPLDPAGFADTVGRYVQEVEKLADDGRQETEEMNRELEEHELAAAADPTQTFVPPAPRAPVPHLNFAPLENAVAALQRSVRDYQRAADGHRALPAAAAAIVDADLMATERALVQGDGLPRRPWYRHQIYAPGFYTGYGVKTLPGVREAIEQRDWKEAEEQAVVEARAIAAFAAEVDRATAAIQAAPGS